MEAPWGGTGSSDTSAARPGTWNPTPTAPPFGVPPRPGPFMPGAPFEAGPAPRDPWATPPNGGPPAFGGPPPPGAGAWASPGLGGTDPTSQKRSPKAGAGRATVAVTVVVVLALVAGFVTGRVTGSATPSAVFASGASGGASASQPTLPAPLKGNEAEPVAAVARVLSPAVVQLQTSSDLGSGVIYDASGLILTAAHVVGDQDTMRVRMADGTQTDGKVLGADQSTDIAVVKIDPTPSMPVAVLATGIDPQVGQMAIAIGSPYGLDQTVTSGIVSAVGRAVETPGGEVAMIQTDAPINPGNSGGALADRLGRVIGINDSIINGNSSGAEAGNVGVGFAIPIDLAKDVADRIVAGEPLTAGYLGVRGSDATGSRSGALIVSVEAGSPAAAAGVQEGDVVTAADDTRIGSMVDLAAAVRTHQPGDEVRLTVYRNGKVLTLTAKLGKSGS